MYRIESESKHYYEYSDQLKCSVRTYKFDTQPEPSSNIQMLNKETKFMQTFQSLSSVDHHALSLTKTK